MKYLLPLLLIVCLSASSAPLQARYDEANPATSVSATFANPVTAGSLLVVGVRPSNGGTATVTRDGRTFTRDARSPIITEFSYEIHSLSNASAGTAPIVASVSGGSDQQRMWSLEMPGTYGIVHKTNFANGSGSALNAGNIITTIASCLIICGGASDSDEFHTDPSPGSGYTMVDLQTEFDDDKTAVEWRVVSSTGTYAGNMTDDQTPDWQCIVVAYGAFSGGGGGGADTAYRNKGKSVAKGFGPVF